MVKLYSKRKVLLTNKGDSINPLGLIPCREPVKMLSIALWVFPASRKVIKVWLESMTGRTHTSNSVMARENSLPSALMFLIGFVRLSRKETVESVSATFISSYDKFVSVELFLPFSQDEHNTMKINTNK